MRAEGTAPGLAVVAALQYETVSTGGRGEEGCDDEGDVERMRAGKALRVEEVDPGGRYGQPPMSLHHRFLTAPLRR
jgi:hypothetical protein